MPDVVYRQVQKIDKVYMMVFLLGTLGFAFLVLSQQSVDAVMLYMFTLAAVPLAKKRDTRLEHLFWVAIPVGIKIALGMFADLTDTLIMLQDMISVVAIMILIASGEEAFRAIIYTLVKGLEEDTPNETIDKSALLFSNAAWIILHFVRRQELLANISLALVYAIWLFIAGVAFTVLWKKCGLGYAVLAHFLLNSF